MMTLSEQWSEDGYCFQKGLFDAEEMSDILRISENVWQQWLSCSPENGEPGDRNNRSMRHLNHPDYFKDNPEDFVTLMNFIADERIQAFAEEVLGTKSVFRTITLWFEPDSAGASEDGNWHRDIQFNHPNEDDQKRMIAEREKTQGIQVQVALVDTEDNEYVPGSHVRWDTDDEYRIRLSDEQAHCKSNDMPGALRVKQEPGDALAFDPLGLHRGRYHHDIKRRTVMLSYTSDDRHIFDYFSDQPWMLNHAYMSLLPEKTRAFFQRYLDIYEDDLKSHTKIAPEFRGQGEARAV